MGSLVARLGRRVIRAGLRGQVEEVSVRNTSNGAKGPAPGRDLRRTGKGLGVEDFHGECVCPLSGNGRVTTGDVFVHVVDDAEYE